MTRQSRDFGVGPDTPGHTSPLFGASAGWRRQHAARDKHAVIAATAVNAALCASAPLSHQTTTTTTTISHVHQTHISPSLGWARPCFGASASICSKFALPCAIQTSSPKPKARTPPAAKSPTFIGFGFRASLRGRLGRWCGVVVKIK